MTQAHPCPGWGAGKVTKSARSGWSVERVDRANALRADRVGRKVMTGAPAGCCCATATRFAQRLRLPGPLANCQWPLGTNLT